MSIRRRAAIVVAATAAVLLGVAPAAVGDVEAAPTPLPAGLSYAVQLRLEQLTHGSALGFLQTGLAWPDLQNMIGSVAQEGGMVDPTTGLPWTLTTLLQRSWGPAAWESDTSSEVLLSKQVEAVMNHLDWRLAQPTPSDPGTSWGSTYRGTSGLDIEDLGRAATATTDQVCTEKNGIYTPSAGLVTLWKSLYATARGGATNGVGSLNNDMGSIAIESGSPPQAQAGLERQDYQAQLPAPGGVYGPVPGFRVDQAKLVLVHIFPTSDPGSIDQKNGYTARELKMTATISTAPSNVEMTNSAWGEAGTDVPVKILYDGASSYPWTAEIDVPLKLMLKNSDVNSLEPKFHPALRVQVRAQEPPPGFPDSRPPFGACGWAAYWIPAFGPNWIYHEVFPPLKPIEVTLPQHVRNSDTPKPMVDRIPPRVDTPESVTVTGLPSGVALQVSVEGPLGQEGDGSVTVNGKRLFRVETDGTAKLNLQGVETTTCDSSPGPKLTLQAAIDGAVITQSKPFAVSAIPENFYENFDSSLSGRFDLPLAGQPDKKVTIEVQKGLLVGAYRGIVVEEKFHSDSGRISDLCTDQTELVQAKKGPLGSTSGYLPGSKYLPDVVGEQVSNIHPSQELLLDQIHLFNDDASTSKNIPATNSGYRDRYETDDSGNHITTCKWGMDVTVKGVITGTKTRVQASVAAGDPKGEAGAICRTQAV